MMIFDICVLKYQETKLLINTLHSITYYQYDVDLVATKSYLHIRC